ncbi:FxDxF family PEP-CTERM protein [Roseateles sp. P5_E4]
MARFAGFRQAALALALAATWFATMVGQAHAMTREVDFNVLNATATLQGTFGSGDTLIVDTVVTQETGALSQSVTFTLGAGITGLTGRAVWEISTAAGPGPRLVGVNIDIFDASNTLVISDAFGGVLAGYAVSTFDGAIGPGTYHLVANGTAVRDAVLNISISAVPEPRTYALLLAGIGAVGLLARRRRLG